MTILGHLVVLGEWAIVAGIILGLVENTLRQRHAITIECPQCGGAGEYVDYAHPEWCEVCRGTGRVDEDGEADRAYDRVIDRANGVA